eukprot:SAG11_NODE_35989_length_264_cov_0.569697_1_plen_58_part_10
MASRPRKNVAHVQPTPTPVSTSVASGPRTNVAPVQPASTPQVPASIVSVQPPAEVLTS